MQLVKSMAVLGTVAMLSACSNMPTSLGGKPQDPDPVAPGGAGGAGGVAGITLPEIDERSDQYFNQVIGQSVLFEVDQASLTPAAIDLLNKQAAWLNVNTDRTVLIEGHADEQGTREYNLALGARRASAVRDYLVTMGLADNRIRTTTYGKERPLAICSDETCWSKNRRAVTVVAGGFNS